MTASTSGGAATVPEVPGVAALSRGLRQLIAAAEETLGSASHGSAGPPDTALDAIRLAMAEVLDQPGLLGDCLLSSPPLPRSGVGKYLLHREDRFVLFATVTAPGAVIPAHDHGGWGIVGIHRGLEEEIQYVKTQLATADGAVGLAETRRLVHAAGSITTIRPPSPDIHVIVNRFEQNSVGLHLFGHDLVTAGFRGYVPAHLEVETGSLDYDELPAH